MSKCPISQYQKARMSPTIIAILLVFLTFLCSLIHTIITASSSRPKLPPGPRALPIIGNLHMLGNLPHRSLQHLAKKYGPIMSMRLGNIPAIVVSSPTAAELFLKTHDTIFASRPKVQASEYMSYGTKGMAFTEYGPYWRHIRKLCTLQLLCPSKIEGFAPLRWEEVGLFVRSLKKAAAAGEVVDLSEKVGGLVEDITYRMVLGRKNDDMFDLKGTVEETLFLAGAFNIGDYVPFLSPLDLQGLAKRMKRISRTIDQLFEKIIGEHEQVSKSGQVQGRSHKDFVDVLLSLIHQPLNPNDEQVYMMERTNVKAILLDMISGAFDTSATAIVWTLVELLRHPRVMKHLQQELQSVIGMDRMVEESDLPKLGYLSMVVKESLRLHPVAPLLIPHESMEDITVEGFDIPKKSRIFINTWAIGRDPKVWSENVEEFYPERFIDGNIDLRGHDFQLLPFGSGRRGCPAMQLGLTTVRLALANLVHCFNWDLPSGLKPKDLDMTEKFGLSLSKAIHLFAMPTYRLSNQLS
ncbi:cytochrome P450 CYP736A12-like [Prunus avium]|uniref:Cytochrome P450 CYP736A12-like n=1 Tax=Prunus avium TaxID=42229 RepID=A0A6P5S8C5_PRUAV|nr:cytochrome P450 CYP736A12-like [Prunus avium]